ANQIRSGHATSDIIIGQPGFLGVEVRNLQAGEAGQLGLNVNSGALVVGVVSGMPAAKAGIRSPSVITSVAGHRVDSADGLGFIRLSAAGDVTSSCPSPTPSPSPSESPAPSPSPSESPSPSSSPSESPSPDQGDQDEQGDQGTSDDHESDDQGDQGTSEQESSDCKDSKKDTTKPGATTADRQKACMAAAGMSGPTVSNDSSQVKTTGLDHAIERVLANCIKNPQAPGLLNALRHLVANGERHAAHDEEKAARKAAHEAAKAARKAAKVHGH